MLCLKRLKPESSENSPGLPTCTWFLSYSPMVAGKIWEKFPFAWVQKKIQTLVNLTMDFEPWSQLDDMVWLWRNSDTVSTYPVQRVGLDSLQREGHVSSACVSPYESEKEEMILHLDWAQILILLSTINDTFLFVSHISCLRSELYARPKETMQMLSGSLKPNYI